MANKGGSTKQTSASTPTLPPELRDAYKGLTGLGQQLIGQSKDDQYASTYAPMSDATRSATDIMAQRGLNGMPLANEAYGAAGGLIGSQPVAGTDGLASLARGEQSIQVPGQNQYMGGLANMGGPTTRGTGMLEQAASGSLMNSNPHADAQFGKIAEAIRTNVGNAANTRGLAGSASGIEQNVLGRNIGDAATSFYGNIYETDMNRALQSGTTLAGLSQNDQARGLAGMQSAAGLAESGMDRGIGVQQQNINNQMGATQGLSGLATDQANRQLAGINSLSGLGSYANQDIGMLLSSGLMQDADTQARTADEAAAQNYQQDQPWQRALQYAQLLGLSAGPQTGQTTTGTAQQQRGIFDWVNLFYGGNATGG